MFSAKLFYLGRLESGVHSVTLVNRKLFSESAFLFEGVKGAGTNFAVVSTFRVSNVR